MIKPSIVWCNTWDVAPIVPNSMGQPRVDQLQGTNLEQLVEIAGRICYDSLGKGRGSADYHQHIKEVNHGSVWEHGNIVIQITNVSTPEMFSLFNRPGLFVCDVEPVDNNNYRHNVRMVVNLRTIREWDRFGDDFLGPWIRDCGHAVAPMIINVLEGDKDHLINYQDTRAKIVCPERDDEIWYSVYLGGSRGFSHELVRHGDFTAISQRSTRYCDENESDYHQHPLFIKYLGNVKGKETGFGSLNYGEHFWYKEELFQKMANNLGVTGFGSLETFNDYDKVITMSLGDEAKYLEDHEKSFYRRVVKELRSSFEKDPSFDKLSSLKQARGAARGFLANALSTELVFSASVAQWKRIFTQRVNPAADKEIFEIMSSVKELIG
jgi:thymidylate synthase ThyX